MMFNHNISNPENFDFVKDTISQNYYLIPNEKGVWDKEKVFGYLLKLEGDTLVNDSDTLVELNVDNLDSLVVRS